MAKPVKHYGKWRIRWVDENCKRKSEVLDTYREAESVLRKRLLEVEEIKSGLRAPLPPEKTFSQLCDYYLTHISALKRRRRDDEGIIRVHLRPNFDSRPLRQMPWFEAINDFKLKRAHLSPKTLHNQLTLLISMLRVAKELGWIQEIPRVKKPKLRLFERDFRYLRTDDEIRRFLLAAREEGEMPFALYSTAVYTGLRQGEIAGLEWQDVDLGRRLITVQRSFQGPTKGGDIRHVPILDPLLPVLRKWRIRSFSKLVFPSEAGTMLLDSARVFQEVLHRTLDQADFPKEEVAGRVRRYITFHSLRHTFASTWMRKGGSQFRLQRILGHKSNQMTERYSHLAPEVFAEDFSRFGDALPSAPASVVALPAS